MAGRISSADPKEHAARFAPEFKDEDEEAPPFVCNDQARRIALEIALLLKSNIIEEMHVCRKNYLDGSVPCGFQRTMILAKDGFVILENGKKISL